VRHALATLLAVALGGAALVHLYWGLGGRTAWLAAVPELEGRPAFAPSRVATLAVAAALGLAALLVASAGGLIGSGPPPRTARVLTGALAVALVARSIGDFRLVGFFKRVRGSRFARLDSAVYSPLCLALGSAAGLVAWLGA
jgi:hypothetical protein